MTDRSTREAWEAVLADHLVHKLDTPLPCTAFSDGDRLTDNDMEVTCKECYLAIHKARTKFSETTGTLMQVLGDEMKKHPPIPHVPINELWKTRKDLK